MYHAANDTVIPRNKNMINANTLLCSFSSVISLSILISFSSSCFSALYIKGMHAITVRNTITKLA